MQSFWQRLQIIFSAKMVVDLCNILGPESMIGLSIGTRIVYILYNWRDPYLWDHRGQHVDVHVISCKSWKSSISNRSESHSLYVVQLVDDPLERPAAVHCLWGIAWYVCRSIGMGESVSEKLVNWSPSPIIQRGTLRSANECEEKKCKVRYSNECRRKVGRSEDHSCEANNIILYEQREVKRSTPIKKRMVSEYGGEWQKIRGKKNLGESQDRHCSVLGRMGSVTDELWRPYEAHRPSRITLQATTVRWKVVRGGPSPSQPLSSAW